MITTHLKSILLAATLIGSVAMAGSAAAADTKWEKHHPRREQVNHRLDHQNQRIHQEVKAGDMPKTEARHLHKEDRMLRHEERRMAEHHDGHLTKGEQRKLNHQENAVSKEIGR